MGLQKGKIIQKQDQNPGGQTPNPIASCPAFGTHDRIICGSKGLGSPTSPALLPVVCIAFFICQLCSLLQALLCRNPVVLASFTWGFLCNLNFTASYIPFLGAVLQGFWPRDKFPSLSGLQKPWHKFHLILLFLYLSCLYNHYHTVLPTPSTSSRRSLALFEDSCISFCILTLEKHIHRQLFLRRQCLQQYSQIRL